MNHRWRDSDGNWIWGFYDNIGIAKSLAAELWGLRYGLTLARKLKIRILLIEIDAKSVVDLLSSNNILATYSHPYSALVAVCWICANLLAKVVNNGFDSFLEITSPSFIVSKLLMDI